jgi:L-threonylcarbamoyladenylate synthase
MLQGFGTGIVGPSANTYGRLSPTTAEHVQNDLGNKVTYILDGGPCEIGIESTIVYFKNDEVYILRQGHITETDLNQVLGTAVVNVGKEASTIRVPGMLKTHYAPTKPLFLVSATELLPIYNTLMAKGLKYNYLCLQDIPAKVQNSVWQQMPNQAELYAKNLYSVLHQLDTADIQGIIIESPPQQASWSAIIDRLTRASSGALTLEMVMQE